MTTERSTIPNGGPETPAVNTERAPRKEPRPADPNIDGTHFRGGHDVVHADGTRVRYADDQWVLATTPRRTVRFGDLPDWLREPAKRHAAVAWLDEGRSSGAVRQVVGAARWWARCLGDLAAGSLVELTPDHARRVRDALLAEAENAREALEAAGLGKGSGLSQRERRQALREAGGRTVPMAFAAQINAICQTMRDQAGWTIPFHVEPLRNPAAEPRGPWSADAEKVLSFEARAALVRVLDHEIRRYTHARQRIEQILGAADYDGLAERLPAGAGVGTPRSEPRRGRRGRPVNSLRAAIALARFFGLHGQPVHSCVELCRALGWSPTSAPGISSMIKGYLGRTLSAAEIAEVCALRTRVKQRSRSGSDAVGAHEALKARLAELGVVCDEAPALLGPDARVRMRRMEVERDREAIEAYCGVRNGVPASLRKVARIYGYGSGLRTTRLRMNARLSLLLGPDVAKRLLVRRDALAELHRRAIKACAVKLQLAVARRVSALLALESDPHVETHVFAGELTCVVRFRATKGWGDHGAPDPVPCPADLAKIAVDAIARAQSLTAPLRAVARREIAERLFLIADRADSGVVALDPKTLAEYVYVNQPGKDGGLLRRYASLLGAVQGFSLHHVRHTNATHLMEGGASLWTVARYLGHNTVGNPEQAAVFYVAGGTAAMRARVAADFPRGDWTGFYPDAFKRIVDEPGTTAGAPEGASRHSQRQTGDARRGPDELTADEALARIRAGEILQPVPHTVEDARAALRRGVVLNLTEWGACLLPAEDGPCPAGGHDCTIGLNPEDPRVAAGQGCRFQVILPHAQQRLEHEIQILHAQLALADGLARSAQWSSHLSEQLRIKEIQLATARELAAGASRAACAGGCQAPRGTPAVEGDA